MSEVGVSLLKLMVCESFSKSGSWFNEADPQDDQPKNKDYKNLIQNVILYTMIEDIEDKQCSDYAEWISILAAKEHHEQKIIYLNYMEEAHQWKVKDKILEIESELLTIRDLLPITDQILAHKRLTSDDLLL